MDNNDNDVDAFTLPISWAPGTDLVSKLLLNDQEIINLIVKSLLGKEARANDYTTASTEWADGTKSDVLYVPKNEVTDMSPPILIEIQYQVNEGFMARLIRCGTSAYNRYNVHPIVLVFAIKGFSNNATKEKFDVSNRGYLLKISSKFWAKECLILSSTSISKYIAQSPMNKLVALGYVLTSSALSLTALEYKSDPTVKRIYSITKQIFSKESNMKDNKANVADQILEHAKQQLTSILEEEDSTEEPNMTKIKHRIQEGIQYIDDQRSALSNNNAGTEGASQQSKVTKKKYTKEDFMFIESMSQPGKSRKWKKIYDQGKVKGLFSSFTSSNNLKASYYHAQKRLKTKQK